MLLYPVFDFNILTMKTSMNKEKKEEKKKKREMAHILFCTIGIKKESKQSLL